MAYDPYKSLLADASRDRLKRSANLNTHLVGNVFLPAIDSQHNKKPPASTTSLKHLKVIEQCIVAENKREERLAKCATIKERRTISKKFQVQRERERELIQALMHEEITGLTGRLATPDRVFRKADVTGGVPTSKPHAHKKFKLPECNGSPGRNISARAQAAASGNLSSPSRKAPPSALTTDIGGSPSQKNPTSSRSAKSARSPKTKETWLNEGTTATVTDAALTSRTQSPGISPHRRQSRRERTTSQLSSLPNTSADADTNEDSSVAFEAALGFSNEPQRIATNYDTAPMKAKCEQILGLEIATQTTPRLLENPVEENGVKKAISRPELSPMEPIFIAAAIRDASATSPCRPQSDRAVRSTRQSFLESLAKERRCSHDRKNGIDQYGGSASNDGDPGSETMLDDHVLHEDEVKSLAGEELSVDAKDALDPNYGSSNADKNGIPKVQSDNSSIEAPLDNHTVPEEEDKPHASTEITAIVKGALNDDGTPEAESGSPVNGATYDDHGLDKDAKLESGEELHVVVDDKDALDLDDGRIEAEDKIKPSDDDHRRAGGDDRAKVSEEVIVGINDVLGPEVELDGSKNDVPDEDRSHTEEEAKLQASEKLIDTKTPLNPANGGSPETESSSLMTKIPDGDHSRAEEEQDNSRASEKLTVRTTNPVDDGRREAENGSPEEEYSDDDDHVAKSELSSNADTDEDLETDVAKVLFDVVDKVAAAIAEAGKQKIIIPSPRTVSPRSATDRTTKYVVRIQSVFRGYRARIAFRLALYEDALGCGVLGAMPGTIQGRSGWYLDPKRLMAYYFVIPDPDGEWEQKYTLRCSKLVLTPYEMRQEVLTKVPAILLQSEDE